MTAYQFVDDIQRADVVPTVGSLGELGKHIGDIHLLILLVEIDLHLVLCVGKLSVKTLVLTRVDVTEDSLFQLFRGTGHAGRIHEVCLGVDAREVLVHGCTIAIVAPLLSQFGIINHVKTRYHRAGVENLLKLLLDETVVEFFSTLGKLLACIGIVLVGSRCGHIAACLTIPVEGVVETFVVTILWPDIIHHAVGIAVLQSQLLGGVIVGIHHKLHHHVGIVAEEGTLLDGKPHGETARLVLLLVFEGSDILVEYLLQLLRLGIVVHHLVLDELRHLHLLLAIEGKGVGCTLLALLAADDVVVAKEIHNFLYLVLDGKARSVHVVDKERGDVVDGGREVVLVVLRYVAHHEEHVSHTDGKACPLGSVSLVGACHAQGIVHRFLSASLQAFLEHIVVELIEGDELARFGICVCLGSGVDHLDDASLVALHLLGHIAEVEERVEHLHDQSELVRHKGIIIHEILLRLVAVVRRRQLELQVETCLIFIVERSKFWLHLLFLVENTLLGNHLGLCAFERYFYFEASFNLALLVFFFCDVAVIHNLGEVLLGGTSHPHLVVASLGELGDNLLEVEIAVALLVDELAHLIGKEDKAVIIALVFQIGGKLHAEAVDAHIGIALDDALADAVHGECRRQLLGYVEYPVQLVVDEVGSHARVVPVGTFLGDTLLEGFEHTFLLKWLFEVLCQGDVELVEATLAVELVPEDMKESLLLVGGVVVARFEVEDASVDGGTLQPVGDGEQLIIVEAEVVLVIERINGFHRFQQPTGSVFTGGRRDTIVEVFQEV